MELASLVESLLFVAAEPVAVSRLASALDVSEAEVEQALEQLSQAYRERGLRLQRKGQQVQLTTAPESAPYVERFLGLNGRVSSRLSPAALETLAIIAYRQPITRIQIEAVRGVSCDGVLRTLLNWGLIEEVGRLEQVGRPILYGTTFAFLQYFGLEGLHQLPPLDGDDSKSKTTTSTFEGQRATSNQQQDVRE